MSELKAARHFEKVSAEHPPATIKAGHHFEHSAFVQYEAQPDVTELKQPHRWWWRLTGITILLISVMAVWQWLELLQLSWQQNVFKATLLTLLSTAVVILFGALLWREFRLWRRLSRNRQWQQNARRINESVQYGEAATLCQDITATLPNTADVQDTVRLWQATTKDQLSDKEQLQLFDKLVLSALDKRAQALVYRAATDTSFAVAISPFALADMLMVLWRSSRLLRELAQLYGGAIGQLRSLVLLKRLFSALLWAGGSELALDMASDVFSSELTAKLSMRAGQGLIAGLLVARIGNLAQQQLRPLPLNQHNKISLSKLASTISKRLNANPAN